MDEDTRNNMAHFIDDDERWPNWPICPMKRRKGTGEFPDIAMLFAPNKARIIHAGMWDDKEKIKNAKTTEYASIHAMLLDGWEVD